MCVSFYAIQVVIFHSDITHEEQANLSPSPSPVLLLSLCPTMTASYHTYIYIYIPLLLVSFLTLSPNFLRDLARAEAMGMFVLSLHRSVMWWLAHVCGICWPSRVLPHFTTTTHRRPGEEGTGGSWCRTLAVPGAEHGTRFWSTPVSSSSENDTACLHLLVHLEWTNDIPSWPKEKRKNISRTFPCSCASEWMLVLYWFWGVDLWIRVTSGGWHFSLRCHSVHKASAVGSQEFAEKTPHTFKHVTNCCPVPANTENTLTPGEDSLEACWCSVMIVVHSMSLFAGFWRFCVAIILWCSFFCSISTTTFFSNSNSKKNKIVRFKCRLLFYTGSYPIWNKHIPNGKNWDLIWNDTLRVCVCFVRVCVLCVCVCGKALLRHRPAEGFFWKMRYRSFVAFKDAVQIFIKRFEFGLVWLQVAKWVVSFHYKDYVYLVV